MEGVASLSTMAEFEREIKIKLALRGLELRFFRISWEINKNLALEAQSSFSQGFERKSVRI